MASAALPKTIGPYRIKSVLGEGGMGLVYRAEQPSLEREVALKVLSEGLIDREDIGVRFVREAKAMARINHPHVITCYDVGRTDDGELFMALEIVQGGDVAQLMQRRGGQLAEDEALAIIRDAAAGLSAIEEAGLIHRDIKPANIFITKRGTAKLADLGLARGTSNDQLTSPGIPVGTPAYMAPEQAEGLADIDVRTDIYALGATLWCMLFGKPPFIGESPVATLVKIIHDPLPDPRSMRGDLSAETVAILTKAMAKKRADRWRQASDLQRACERALERANGAHQLRRDPLAGQSSQPELSAPPQKSAHVEQNRQKPDQNPLPSADNTQQHLNGRRGGASANGASHRQEVGGQGAPPMLPGQKVSAPPQLDSPAKSSEHSPLGVAAQPGSVPTPTPHQNVTYNRKQLLVLAKRVRVTPDGNQAFLALAPESSFPHAILEQLLEVKGITHGVIPGALIEASRRSRQSRRIVLAEGDVPTPGVPGRDVFGSELPPPAEPVMVQIADDRMAAYALFRPGELCNRKAVELAVRQSRICFGIDRGAISRLWEGPPNHSGRIRIAQGAASRPGRPAGFHLAGGVAEVSLTVGEVQNLAQVTAGAVLATWQEVDPSRDGMDVFGHRVPVLPLRNHTPEQQAGEGTDVGRGRNGALELRAATAGYVQQRFDGSIRVVQAVEISGDLNAESAPIDSDDVVVVRGSVQAGAQITSAADVVIMGDLADAQIEAGGSIEIHGDVCAGQAPLMAVDEIKVVGTCSRRIVAGNLRIAGTVDRCDLVASGDITVNKVIGGSLKAGGNVICDHAGDRYATTTELSAGTNPCYEEQARIAQLAERKFKVERERLQNAARLFQSEANELNRKQRRHQNAAWINQAMVDRQRDRLQQIENQQLDASNKAEQARAQLAAQRGMINDIRNAAADPNATITVRACAHAGVVVSIGGSDQIRLRSDEFGFCMGEGPSPGSAPADSDEAGSAA